MSAFLRGYVQELTNLDIIGKLPDGSFGADQKVTKAEAAVVITKAKSWMENGIDPSIKVVAKRPTSAAGLDIKGTKQMIDNVIYVSAGELYKKAAPKTKFIWDPGNQILAFEYGTMHEFQAGNLQYGYAGDINENSKKFQAPSRLLYGEMMIPVDRIDMKPVSTDMWEAPSWDGGTKTLIVPLKGAGK